MTLNDTLILKLRTRVRDALMRALHGSGLGEVDCVQLERYWPGKKGDDWYEWSVCVDTATRVLVYSSPSSARIAPQIKQAGPAIVREGRLMGVSEQMGEGLSLHSFEQDPNLLQIRESIDPIEVDATLSRFDWKLEMCPKISTAKLRSYRVGKRAVVHYGGSASQSDSVCGLTGKLFKDARGAELLERHLRVGQAIAEQDRSVRVVTAIGYEPALRMLVMERIKPGRSRTGQIQDIRGIDAHSRVLAALHRLQMPELTPYSMTDELSGIDRWARCYASLSGSLPDNYLRVRESLNRLIEHIDPTQQVVCHRDYYPDQLMLDDKGYVLLDLDTLSSGHPALDLGNLACHLLLESVLSGEEADPLRLLDDILLSYRKHDGRTGLFELRLYCITSLLRVALVHGQRRQSPGVAPALLRHALSVLQQIDDAEQSHCAPAAADDRLTALSERSDRCEAE